MNRLLPSTSLRLALGYAALFILSSLILVGVLWWQTTGYLDREVDAVIVADTRAIGDRLRDFGLPGAIATINERITRTADEHTVYLLTDPGLSPIAGNVDAWPLEVPRTPGWYRVNLVRGDKVYATRVLSVDLPNHFHLLVGRDVQDRVVIRELIVRALAWAGAIAILLALLGGFLVRRSVLRRIQAIDAATRAIVRGDLSQRIPSRDSSDELDRLTRTINDMLAQIEILVDGVRNTSNAIAHDLRTPLAELRTRLEGLLRQEHVSDTTAGELTEAVADIDRLIGIFNALLRLAELDSGVQRAAFGDVDLAALVSQVAELYAPIAEDKKQMLEADAQPLTIRGDRFLIAQAVGNLVDNAIKYTPAGGHIKMTATRMDGACAIAVADSGPGIAAADRERAVERFYRGDASRGTPGVGLGLSLVAAVARLHGGRLELRDNDPGLVATLVLPDHADVAVSRH
ncbi:MAG: ATP-binding protein [Gemmatimonas sp.]